MQVCLFTWVKFEARCCRARLQALQANEEAIGAFCLGRESRGMELRMKWWRWRNWCRARRLLFDDPRLVLWKSLGHGRSMTSPFLQLGGIPHLSCHFHTIYTSQVMQVLAIHE